LVDQLFCHVGGGLGRSHGHSTVREHSSPSSPMARGSVQPRPLRAVLPALDDACDSASIRTVQIQVTEYVPAQRTDPRSSRDAQCERECECACTAMDVSPTPRGIHIWLLPAPTSSSTWPSCRCSLTCQLLTLASTLSTAAPLACRFQQQQQHSTDSAHARFNVSTLLPDSQPPTGSPRPDPCAHLGDTHHASTPRASSHV
jgi:hypothetical protein